MIFVRMCAGYELYGHSEPIKEGRKWAARTLKFGSQETKQPFSGPQQ